MFDGHNIYGFLTLAQFFMKNLPPYLLEIIGNSCTRSQSQST